VLRLRPPRRTPTTATWIETNTSVDVDEPETYAQEIDEDTRLVEWEYDEDREGFIYLRFETDSRTTMTLTEAVQFDEGAGGGRIYQQRLPAGMTEIFVSVPTRAGQAALTMTTPGLIANNRYSYVSTGVSQFGGEPISYGRVQLLVGNFDRALCVRCDGRHHAQPARQRR